MGFKQSKNLLNIGHIVNTSYMVIAFDNGTLFENGYGAPFMEIYTDHGVVGHLLIL